MLAMKKSAFTCETLQLTALLALIVGTTGNGAACSVRDYSAFRIFRFFPAESFQPIAKLLINGTATMNVPV